MGGKGTFDTRLWHGGPLRAQALVSELHSRGIVSLSKSVPLTEFCAGMTIDTRDGRVVRESRTECRCGEFVTVLVRKDDYERAKEVLQTVWPECEGDSTSAGEGT